MITPSSACLALALLAVPSSKPPTDASSDDVASRSSSAEEAEEAEEAEAGVGEGEDEADGSGDEDDEVLPTRRFMLGLEGVVMQAPPLRPQVVTFDPRFIGRTVSLGGLGLFARLRVHPRISVEATVRSGSARYAARPTEDPDVVSHDQVAADVGVLLFVARGQMVQLAFDGGVGGMGTRVRYELDREGTQLFGSGIVRVGANAEFLVKRIAFVVSVRAMGVLTNVERVRNRGELLQGRDLPAPVPAMQTLLVGSAGIAYRF
ncbi:MAG: hypothetical protein H6712_07620 [Myxococcales bacterium]|nr:hypothetical protein [Myxococcales bacterium]MCB9713704.1 hypothetical protein [Myxococcales bacterium]